MAVGTLGDAQAIAHDVAIVLDAVASELDRRADRALSDGRREQAIAQRQLAEEITRQVQRLRDV